MSDVAVPEHLEAPSHAHAARPDQKRRWLWPVVSGVGVIGAATYIFTQDPNQPGHYFDCPLKSVTGVACPGCGGIRAAYAAMHGDVWLSLRRNPLAIPIALFALVLWARWALRETGLWKTRRRAIPVWLPVTVTFGFLFIFVTRNIDWGPFPWFEDPTATRLLFG
jgi:hypothetical protein